MTLPDPGSPPRWEDDRVGWCAWYLLSNPQVYKAYRELADDYRLHNPERICSSDLFFNVLRYFSVVRAWGDEFSINNNAKSLFARLYQIERPEARFENRRSWVDDMTEDDWTAIFDVFAPISEGWVNPRTPPLSFEQLFHGLLDDDSAA
ncbi:hypothetical protein IHN63_00645 [Deinococcus sp. 6YEL10]|uniref:hypothetical protein n=1 Tax=Deinococcus sp. 6YEL10 TaxID=2745870 RepID=UPI001E53B351|nr:hypothetical protein [Deinococcus sp. 6YEL10]MCD0159808.1 hypothetical protein [Deinococcus sp. 6YEL10]